MIRSSDIDEKRIKSVGKVKRKWGCWPKSICSNEVGFICTGCICTSTTCWLLFVSPLRSADHHRWIALTCAWIALGSNYFSHIFLHFFSHFNLNLRCAHYSIIEHHHYCSIVVSRTSVGVVVSTCYGKHSLICGSKCSTTKERLSFLCTGKFTFFVLLANSRQQNWQSDCCCCWWCSGWV